MRCALHVDFVIDLNWKTFTWTCIFYYGIGHTIINYWEFCKYKTSTWACRSQYICMATQEGVVYGQSVHLVSVQTQISWSLAPLVITFAIALAKVQIWCLGDCPCTTTAPSCQVIQTQSSSAVSCSALPTSCCSGYYWVRSSNGAVVQIYVWHGQGV